MALWDLDMIAEQNAVVLFGDTRSFKTLAGIFTLPGVLHPDVTPEQVHILGRDLRVGNLMAMDALSGLAWLHIELGERIWRATDPGPLGTPALMTLYLWLQANAGAGALETYETICTHIEYCLNQTGDDFLRDLSDTVQTLVLEQAKAEFTALAESCEVSATDQRLMLDTLRNANTGVDEIQS